METPQIYYALAQLCYSAAKANKNLTEREKIMLHDIFTSELKQEDLEVDFSEIISNIMEKEEKNFETTYNWALHLINLQGTQLNGAFKPRFIEIIRKVLNAFPPAELDSEEILRRLESDLH